MAGLMLVYVGTYFNPCLLLTALFLLTAAMAGLMLVSTLETTFCG